MQLISLLTSLAFVSAVVADNRGSYTVAGLGARKKEVLNAGGNTRDMAIAMLET